MNSIISDAEQRYLASRMLYDLTNSFYEVESFEDKRDAYNLCAKYFSEQIDSPNEIIDAIRWACNNGIEVAPGATLSEIESIFLKKDHLRDSYKDIHVVLQLAGLFCPQTYPDDVKLSSFFTDEAELERLFSLALSEARTVDEFIWLGECVAGKYQGWNIQDQDRTDRVLDAAKQYLTSPQMKKLNKKIAEFQS